MTWTGWLQILVTLGLVLATAPLLASHMARVHRGERTLLHPLLGPLERLFYRLMGVDPSSEQDWRGYSVAMLAFHAVGFAVLLAILLLQGVLPMNPQGFDGLSWHLALNTAVSFVTNTNWQSYSGESTMSHFSQMAGLAVQNFASAAAGIALAMAVTRAFARSASRTLGNFWVDLVRSTLYILLPLSFVLAVVLVARGVPQTFQPSVTVTTLEGVEQVIPLGPVASQEAIKQLGTNGGGYYNANSAHPLENPDAWTNLLATWALLALACALPLTFGEMVGDRRQGRALLAAMFVLLLAGVGACYLAEASGNPILHGLGVAEASGSMEGKEVRFGVAASALWAAATAGTSCGAVNAMHDSLTPLGGLVPLFLIQLGEVLPGGVGSGIYGMLVFAVLSVFVAGLMVGRTPEYLGKKIGADQMKMAMLAVLILPVAILGLAAVAASTEAGRSAVLNAGPHGLSEILYAYSSAGGNNGSAFAGLGAATPFYDTTLALGMILGRLGYVLPVLAMAGSLALQGKAEPSAGTLPTDGPLFVGLLVGVIVIVGGLQFLPALVLGPVVEHLMMLAGHGS